MLTGVPTPRSTLTPFFALLAVLACTLQLTRGPRFPPVSPKLLGRRGFNANALERAKNREPEPDQAGQGSDGQAASDGPSDLAQTADGWQTAASGDAGSLQAARLSHSELRSGAF